MPWNITSCTKTLDLLYPIIQAPMAGSFCTPVLAATVSNYGCLGSLAAGYLQADALDIAIQQTKKATAKPLLINFFIPAHTFTTTTQMHTMHTILMPFAHELGIELLIPTPPFVPSLDSQLEVFLDHRLSILSFTFGLLETKWIKRLKERRVILIGTATSTQEALLLEQSGIDFIVCQGKEAGGHRGSFIHDARLPTFDLLKQCLATVKTPLIASGGIMQGKEIIQALTLGAAAIQMGSIFLTTEEAGTPLPHRNALLHIPKGSTILTRIFTGKYARAFRNRFAQEMESHNSSILPYPIQRAFAQPIYTAATQHNRTELLPLWAGENSFLCQKVSTQALLDRLIQECTQQ